MHIYLHSGGQIKQGALPDLTTAPSSIIPAAIVPVDLTAGDRHAGQLSAFKPVIEKSATKTVADQIIEEFETIGDENILVSHQQQTQEGLWVFF